MNLGMFTDVATHGYCPYGPGPWHAVDDGDNEFVGCGASPLDAITRLVEEMEPWAVAAKRAHRNSEEDE